MTEAEMAGVLPRDRCVWGAVCSEAVTRLYSKHFREVFWTEEAFSLVWEFVSTGTIDQVAAKKYIRRCSRMGQSAEAVAYGLPNGMLAALVAEMLYPTGAAAVECVGFCARLYPQILFFRHGIDDRLANFNGKHIDALMVKYHRFSRTILDFVTRRGGNHKRGEYSSLFALDPHDFTLSRKLYVANPPLVGRREPMVPRHEIIAGKATGSETRSAQGNRKAPRRKKL